MSHLISANIANVTRFFFSRTEALVWAKEENVREQVGYCFIGGEYTHIGDRVCSVCAGDYEKGGSVHGNLHTCIDCINAEAESYRRAHAE
jgi:hypothetical protein